MNERQTQLSEQLVASKHWRWMSGMLDSDGNRTKAFSLLDVEGLDRYPILDDPATIGCLLALVREVYGPRVWLMWSRGRAPRMEGGDSGFCELRDAFGRRVFSGEIVEHRTEAEALAAALLEAP